MVGPVGSEYPGTATMLAFVCLFAFIIVRSLLSTQRQKREVTGRQNRRADVVVASLAAFLLAIALWAVWIYQQRPK
jgi:EamA domain-containing membrane protein RarD